MVIPKQIYLEYWFHPYKQGELKKVFKAEKL